MVVLLVVEVEVGVVVVVVHIAGVPLFYK